VNRLSIPQQHERKSGKSNRRGGRGRNERSWRGRGRGHSYTGTSKTQKSGLRKALESNVFDYGHKAAVDQMRTSCEKLVQYVGYRKARNLCRVLLIMFKLQRMNDANFDIMSEVIVVWSCDDHSPVVSLAS
jgi:hypothetical protein